MDRHRGSELLPETKISQRDHKCDADKEPKYTVTPFHVKNVLEFIEGNGVIETVVRSRDDPRSRHEKDAHSLNSGVALYFSNSILQSSAFIGGMMPVMGFHSVMLSPDSVRRVTPPTTITAKTIADENKSQRPTAGGASTGNCDVCAAP